MIQSAYLKFLYALCWCAAIFFVGSVGVVIAEAMGRTTGAFALSWSQATVAYILQFSTMLAAPWVLHVHGHVFMTAVRSMLPDRYKIYQERLVYVVSAALCFGMAGMGAYAAVNAYLTGAVDIRSVTIPEWIIYASLIPGFGLMALEFLRFLFSSDSMFDETTERVTI